MAPKMPFGDTFFFSRRWRGMKIVWGLFAVELVFTVPALALFAIAQPDLYRTRLWQDGFDNRFNSNPEAMIFAMVNRTPYTVPPVWSQFLTDFNVVISVLSMFILLVKGVMFILHIFLPLVGFLTHGLLVALWAYSVHAQTWPDNSDPRFPRLPAPWHIAKSCTVAHDPSNIRYCRQAKAALAVSVVMLFLFTANTLLALISLVPSRSERLARRTRVSLADAEDSQKAQMRFEPPPQTSKQRGWISQQRRSAAAADQKCRSSVKEQRQAGGAGAGGGVEEVELRSARRFAAAGPPRTPVTPRTFALNKLGGGGGGSTAAGSAGNAASGGNPSANASSGGGDLPLREC